MDLSCKLTPRRPVGVSAQGRETPFAQVYGRFALEHPHGGGRGEIAERQGDDVSCNKAELERLFYHARSYAGIVDVAHGGNLCAGEVECSIGGGRAAGERRACARVRKTGRAVAKKRRVP